MRKHTEARGSPGGVLVFWNQLLHEYWSSKPWVDHTQTTETYRILYIFKGSEKQVAVVFHFLGEEGGPQTG